MSKFAINKFITLLVALIIPLGFYWFFKSKGVPPRPHLKKFYAITPDFQSGNTIKVGDTLYHRIGPFSFLDQDSISFTHDDLKDHIFVADFFFTRCGGICPKLTQSLKRVQQKMKEEENLLFLAHTVDPLYDHPSVLKEYGKRFEADFSNWKFLTGYSDEFLYDFVMKNYYVTVMPGTEQSAELFDHTNKLVLVDRNRIIRGYYDGTDSLAVNKLMYDIKVLQLDYRKKKELVYKVGADE